jgi:hypothetical protein
MRTTTLVLLCSFTAACAGPVGSPGSEYDGPKPDAGADAAAAGGPCVELEQVTGDLSIAGASGFEDLPTTCWTLTGTLTVAGPAVTSLDKLGDLRSVTNLEINNTELVTFDTRSPINVTGTIWIRYNSKLSNIAKLEPTGDVGSITIEHNAALTSLGGLTKVARVTGETVISDNASLTSVELGSAKRLEGGLYVDDNPVVSSIDLARLTSVGTLSIANNPALTSIKSSSLLGNVQGTFTINNNDALVSLGSLGMATTFSLNVIVSGNAKLTDLGELSHAQSVIGVVQITNNLALDQTRAHDIGCCVATGGYTSSGNSNNTCAGDHWCLNTQQTCRR